MLDRVKQNACNSRLRKKRLRAGLCRCGQKVLNGTNKCAKCKANQREIRLARKVRLKKAAIAHYGNKCACCDIDTADFLTIDHINNDGAEHRKTTTVNIYIWLWQHDYPAGFQVLCFNCNCAKGIYGECPHQTRIKNAKVSSIS